MGRNSLWPPKANQPYALVTRALRASCAQVFLAKPSENLGNPRRAFSKDFRRKLMENLGKPTRSFAKPVENPWKTNAAPTKTYRDVQCTFEGLECGKRTKAVEKVGGTKGQLMDNGRKFKHN